MEQFTRDGLTFGVTDAGPIGGEVVVLLHGFPQQPSSYDLVLPALHSRGLRTLVPTQRGYAASCRPPRRRDHASSETAADVIALLDAAGVTRAHVVGHDWGGAQAWGVAGGYPNRVASLTVLSTPHPAALLKSFTNSGQALKSWYMGLFQLPWLPEQLAGRTLGKTLTDSRLPPPFVAEYVAAMREPGALTGALNWYRGMPFGAPTGMITVPSTYVWGRYDFALGRAAAEATQAYVSAPYRFVELAAGHWLPETEPGAVAAAVLEQIDGPENGPGD
ncbi:MAG: alpha/beta fold hydrolase [Propionibacteriaceae bacterium]